MIVQIICSHQLHVRDSDDEDAGVAALLSVLIVVLRVCNFCITGEEEGIICLKKRVILFGQLSWKMMREKTVVFFSGRTSVCSAVVAAAGGMRVPFCVSRSAGGAGGQRKWRRRQMLVYSRCGWSVSCVRVWIYMGSECDERVVALVPGIRFRRRRCRGAHC